MSQLARSAAARHLDVANGFVVMGDSALGVLNHPRLPSNYPSLRDKHPNLNPDVNSEVMKHHASDPEIVVAKHYRLFRLSYYADCC